MEIDALKSYYSYGPKLNVANFLFGGGGASIKLRTNDIHQNLLNSFKLRENRQGSWSPQRLKTKTVASIEKLEMSKFASQRKRQKNLNVQYQRDFLCFFSIHSFNCFLLLETLL